MAADQLASLEHGCKIGMEERMSAYPCTQQHVKESVPKIMVGFSNAKMLYLADRSYPMLVCNVL